MDYWIGGWNWLRWWGEEAAAWKLQAPTSNLQRSSNSQASNGQQTEKDRGLRGGDCGGGGVRYRFVAEGEGACFRRGLGPRLNEVFMRGNAFGAPARSKSMITSWCCPPFIRPMLPPKYLSGSKFCGFEGFPGGLRIRTREAWRVGAVERLTWSAALPTMARELRSEFRERTYGH